MYMSHSGPSVFRLMKQNSPIEMFLLWTLQSFYLVLMTEVVCGNPDCNHEKIVTQFFYFCNSYTSPQIKRETNLAKGDLLNTTHPLVVNILLSRI